MSNEGLPAQFTVTMAGREIAVRRAALGQILVLQRLFERARRKGETDPQDQGESMTTVVIKAMDFIDTLILDPVDRQFVEDQMLAGAVSWEEVLAIISGGKGEDETADDEAPKPVKRAPRKSPRAAPVDLSDKKPAQIVVKPTKATKRGSAKR